MIYENINMLFNDIDSHLFIVMCNDNNNILNKIDKDSIIYTIPDSDKFLNCGSFQNICLNINYIQH